ncbi:M16 family metallopeptidase [Ekhidna sp.]|uniref:M16 family metallopeptidase n=1 Tax=Ekhidna sp. TaxID=2608089 RepID=UPI003BAD3597
MKIKNILTLMLTLSLLGSFAQVDRSKLPEPATPRPINIGDYESFELKNGLKVFIIENHKLPRVSYNLVIDREPILEGDKVGYLSMVGQMMRRGTETRTKEQFDQEIDFIGASLGAGSTSVFASGLSKYNEKILELMTDVIFNPTFPEEELEKIRKQTISALASNEEDPGAIASNLNSALLYGKDHPYGEIQTKETVNNITIDDLTAYHEKYFRPNIAYLAVVGDVDVKATKKLMKTYFGNWERGEVEMPTYDTPTAPGKNMVGIVNRPSAVQSNINITYPVDLKTGSEDVIKARVMNQILGGSGSAKLFMNLREDKGYTYGSYSSLSSDELVGRFNASAAVRNEVTDSSVVQIFYEMAQMKKGEISDEEMKLAKNSISGSFSRSLEQPQTVASFALNTARYNLPSDYYSTYLQKVQAVSKEDVMAMADKYLKTEGAYINVVGKASEVADQLKPFGEVKYYDTYGNEVDPSLAKLPEGLTAEKVFMNYIEAIGGKDKLAEVKAVKMNMQGSVMGQTMDMEQTKVSPNMSLVEVKMGGNVVQKIVFDGEKGKMTGMQGNQDITGDMALDMKISSAIVEEVAYLNGDIEAKISSLEKIDGKDAYGVEVKSPSGTTTVRYYDAESGLLVKATSTVESPQGNMTLSSEFGEYKEFGGILFATKLSQPLNAQMKMQISVSEIIVNPEVDASAFNLE